jgi:hypothetical protein
MLKRRDTKRPLDLNMQCWLLAAYCALDPVGDAHLPELRALRRAIQDNDREVIAISLEVTCSRLSPRLSPLQCELTQCLAENLRSGRFAEIRSTALALARASISGQAQAC